MFSFCAEGAIDLVAWMLAQTDRITTRFTDLVIEPFVPTWQSTYGSLKWEGAILNIGATEWTITQLPNTNQIGAYLTKTWNFNAGQAGTVVYGAGLLGLPPTVAMYLDTFPVPYQVPTGGGSFTWTFQLYFGNCSGPTG